MISRSRSTSNLFSSSLAAAAACFSCSSCSSRSLHSFHQECAYRTILHSRFKLHYTCNVYPLRAATSPSASALATSLSGSANPVSLSRREREGEGGTLHGSIQFELFVLPASAARQKRTQYVSRVLLKHALQRRVIVGGRTFDFAIGVDSSEQMLLPQHILSSNDVPSMDTKRHRSSIATKSVMIHD